MLLTRTQIDDHTASNAECKTTYLKIHEQSVGYKTNALASMRATASWDMNNQSLQVPLVLGISMDQGLEAQQGRNYLAYEWTSPSSNHWSI